MIQMLWPCIFITLPAIGTIGLIITGHKPALGLSLKALVLAILIDTLTTFVFFRMVGFCRFCDEEANKIAVKMVSNYGGIGTILFNLHPTVFTRRLVHVVFWGIACLAHDTFVWFFKNVGTPFSALLTPDAIIGYITIGISGVALTLFLAGINNALMCLTERSKPLDEIKK